MVDAGTAVHVAFAFLVGGTWVALATIAADRFGSKIGGFVGGLPSTAVVSFLFIGLVQSPEAASEATTIFPLAYGFTGLFLVSYAILATRGFLLALTASLLIWLLLNGLAVLFDFDDFIAALLAYVIILCLIYLMFARYLRFPAPEQAIIHFSSLQAVTRGIFGGVMVAFAVFMSKVAGPIFGGILSAFPATFTSTLTIAYQAHGLEFSRGMTRSLAITGMITIVVYGIAVRHLYPVCGLIPGTIFSYGVSIVSAYFSYLLIQHKLA